MLNSRLARTLLFCSSDVNDIVERVVEETSSFYGDKHEELLSANQVGRIVCEQIEHQLRLAVEDMRNLRT